MARSIPATAIAKYESIAEVITDKVNAEIPAPADGVMAELIAAEGTVVPVGQPICSIDTGVAASDAAVEPDVKEVAAVGVPAAQSAQAAPAERNTEPAEPQTAPSEPQAVPTAPQAPPARAQAGGETAVGPIPGCLQRIRGGGSGV